MIRPEIQEQFDVLQGVNPYARAILGSGSLVLGNRLTRSGRHTDNFLNINRALRKQKELQVIINGLAKATETMKPDVITGVLSFGANFGERVASELGLPFVRMTRTSIGSSGKKEFIPPNNSTEKAKIINAERVVAVSAFCISKQTVLDFTSSEVLEDKAVGVVIGWRRGNPSTEKPLPTDFLPQYLVEHSIPDFVTVDRT